MTSASTYLRRHAGGPRQVALAARLPSSSRCWRDRRAGGGGHGSRLAGLRAIPGRWARRSPSSLVALAGPGPAGRRTDAGWSRARRTPAVHPAGLGSRAGRGFAAWPPDRAASRSWQPLLALPIAGVASTSLDMAAAVAMFVVGHAMGAVLVWPSASRGANWLARVQRRPALRWARATAGFLLVTLAGWMTANAIMTADAQTRNDFDYGLHDIAGAMCQRRGSPPSQPARAKEFHHRRSGQS
ncbi:MAG: hypothetical protein MZW92_28880 [Comamonadaceae bacterium]|nr:hypothetical protein [Comamonadaceae bacterium]